MVILFGVRCRFEYGPADATATHCLLLQKIQIGLIFLVLAHTGSPGHSPGGRKAVIVINHVMVIQCMLNICQAVLFSTTIH